MITSSEDLRCEFEWRNPDFMLTFPCCQVYVCEDCGHTTKEPEVHYVHLKEQHPYSPALLKFYDKRHFKFNNTHFASNLVQPM